MAQQTAQDDFEPDDFEADDFVPDEPEGKEVPGLFKFGLNTQEAVKFPEVTGVKFDKELPENITLPDGSLVNRRFYESGRTSQAGRGDEQMFELGDQQKFSDLITDKIALSPNIPESLKPNLVTAITSWTNLARSGIDLLSDPLGPALGFLGLAKNNLAKMGLKKAEEEAALAAIKEAAIAHEEANAAHKLVLNPQKAGTPQYNTAQFGLHPSEEPLPYPLSIVPNRLRPPSTNATVFDALIPERLKYNEQGAAQRLTTDVVPPSAVVEETPKDPIRFNGRTLDEIRDNPITSQRLNPIPQIGTHGSALPFMGPTDELPAMGIMGGDMSGARPQATNAIERILDQLEQARPLQQEAREILRAERAQKAARIADKIADSELTPGEKTQGMREALYGEHTKAPDFEPIEVAPEDLADLQEIIINSPKLDKFEKVRAGRILDDLIAGHVPQANEIETIWKTFGQKLDEAPPIGRLDEFDSLDYPEVEDIIPSKPRGNSSIPEFDFAQRQNHEQYGERFAQAMTRRQPKGSRAYHEITNAARAVMSAGDMSAPFRQGGGRALTKEWFQSWKPMVKAFGSKNAFAESQRAIKFRPSYRLAQKSGLDIIDHAKYGKSEEQFLSHLAGEYVPLVGRSERGYTAFLNKLRMDTWDRLMKEQIAQFRSSGTHSPDAIRAYTEATGKSTAKLVNMWTGRGDVNKVFGNFAMAANETLFSPRLTASRIEMIGEMLKPSSYKNIGSDIQRRETVKSALSVLSVMGMVNGMGVAIGGALNMDPRSSDFMKVKFGDTRIDPGAGFLQAIVAAVRMMENESVNSEGKVREFDGKMTSPSDFSIAASYIRNKLNPQWAYVMDRMIGKDFKGDAPNMPASAVKAFTYMFAQDVLSIMQNDPEELDKDASMGDRLKQLKPEMPEDPRAMLAIPASFVGMGSQTYK